MPAGPTSTLGLTVMPPVPQHTTLPQHTDTSNIKTQKWAHFQEARGKASMPSCETLAGTEICSKSGSAPGTPANRVCAQVCTHTHTPLYRDADACRGRVLLDNCTQRDEAFCNWINHMQTGQPWPADLPGGTNPLLGGWAPSCPRAQQRQQGCSSALFPSEERSSKAHQFPSQLVHVKVPGGVLIQCNT